MVKALAGYFRAIVVLLSIIAMPMSSGVGTELHSLAMKDHTIVASMPEASSSSDVTCCTVEQGSSVCTALCAVVDRQESPIVQGQPVLQASTIRLELRAGVKPDPSRRPPRVHLVRGGLPHLV